MAGYREFVSGEVLTAVNVNDFLMKQSTMVFVDAAARTAALDGAEVEGMLTYNLDTAALEVYDGTAFVAARAAGIGSNVVQAVKTNTFTTTSTSYTAVTGLSVTITPTSDTSKILVLLNCTFSNNTENASTSIRMMRGASAIYVGNADGSRTQATMVGSPRGGTHPDQSGNTAVFLDSPAVDTAVTYSAEMRVSAGIGVLNRSSGDLDNSTYGRTTSSITVIEVAV